MNADAPWPDADQARERVLGIQTKLHQWATDDPGRRFDDLYNLVYDPAFLLEAWHRVRGNRGARSSGVDGYTVHRITAEIGVLPFLAGIRADLKARSFIPEPVRERTIPKPGSTKRRRLGIPTVRDRVVQASAKLLLEPIFEADFQPCSYGFRPKRRAQDAIAEIHFFASRSYEHVLEGDIKACFDEIDHVALMDRVRKRIKDKRVLALIKAFLHAGILSEDGDQRNSGTGTPQGGILSPLLANIALSVLDEHFARAWAASGSKSLRVRRRRHDLPNYRLVRYADDFVVLVAGSLAQTEALRQEVAAVLAPMGLQLSETKTKVCHIDEGFDFLGFRIRRKRKSGTSTWVVYTYPSKTALATVKAAVRTLTRGSPNQSLGTLLHRLNPVLRGWANYFRHGVSKATFRYLGAFTWRRTVCWLRHKHPKAAWKTLRRSFLPRWQPTDGETALFNPASVAVTRYPYRGNRIPSPWSTSNARGLSTTSAGMAS